MNKLVARVYFPRHQTLLIRISSHANRFRWLTLNSFFNSRNVWQMLFSKYDLFDCHLYSLAFMSLCQRLINAAIRTKQILVSRLSRIRSFLLSIWSFWFMIYWFWLVVCCCVYCEPRHSHLFTQQIWEIYAKSIAWKMDTSLALHKRSHHRIVYSYGDDEQTQLNGAASFFLDNKLWESWRHDEDFLYMNKGNIFVFNEVQFQRCEWRKKQKLSSTHRGVFPL